jgi:hypothetical protein
MARTELTPTTSDRDGAPITFNAADATNGNYFVNNGRRLLVVKNESTASITATIISVPCSHGRTEDQIISVAAGGQAVAGPFPRDLFNQSGTYNLNVDFSSDSSVTAAVI